MNNLFCSVKEGRGFWEVTWFSGRTVGDQSWPTEYERVTREELRSFRPMVILPAVTSFQPKVSSLHNRSHFAPYKSYLLLVVTGFWQLRRKVFV